VLQALVAIALGFAPDFQVTPVFLVALALLGDPAVALAVGEALAFVVGTPFLVGTFLIGTSLACLAAVVGALALAARFGLATLVGATGLFARPLACKFMLAVGAPPCLATGLDPVFGLAAVCGAAVFEPLTLDAGLVALLRPASTLSLFTLVVATRFGLALFALTTLRLLLACLRPFACLGRALLGLPALGGLARLAGLLLSSPLLSIVLVTSPLLRLLLPLGRRSPRIGGVALAFGIRLALRRLGACLALLVGLFGAGGLLLRLACVVALVLVRAAPGFARRGRCRQAEGEQRHERRAGEGSSHGCHCMSPA